MRQSGILRHVDAPIINPAVRSARGVGKHLLAPGQRHHVQHVGNKLHQRDNDAQDGQNGAALDVEETHDHLQDHGGGKGAYQPGAGFQGQAHHRVIRVLARQAGNAAQDEVGRKQAAEGAAGFHPVLQPFIFIEHGADGAAHDTNEDGKERHFEVIVILPGAHHAKQVQDEGDQGEKSRADAKGRRKHVGRAFQVHLFGAERDVVGDQHHDQRDTHDDGEDLQHFSQINLFDAIVRVGEFHVMSLLSMFTFYRILNRIALRLQKFSFFQAARKRPAGIIPPSSGDFQIPFSVPPRKRVCAHTRWPEVRARLSHIPVRGTP